MQQQRSIVQRSPSAASLSARSSHLRVDLVAGPAERSRSISRTPSDVAEQRRQRPGQQQQASKATVVATLPAYSPTLPAYPPWPRPASTSASPSMAMECIVGIEDEDSAAALARRPSGGPPAGRGTTPPATPLSRCPCTPTGPRSTRMTWCDVIRVAHPSRSSESLLPPQAPAL
jgi:hypothetical protein